MRTFNYLFILLAFNLIFAGLIRLSAQVPGQPNPTYLTPESIANWSPATDPDAPYNISRVPLASGRFMATNVNSNAHADIAGVEPLTFFGNGNGAQGGQSMVYYAPTYWQYMDHLTYWGGVGGSILPPAAPVTDAAHRNGVPVLGTLFFAPDAYGGNISYVNDMLYTPDGGRTFPIADKLILMARVYGFDGWFINQETEGGTSATATAMQQFIQYIHNQAPTLLIEWYDSMINNGQIAYQGQLDSANQMFYGTGNGARVADTMFINYGWNQASTASSTVISHNLGRSVYNLYAGVDFEAGYVTDTGGPVPWTAVFPNGSTHLASLAIFRPDWALSSTSGSTDLLHEQNFLAQEGKTWAGSVNNPSNTSGYVSGSGSTGFRGVANNFLARSAINSMPFATNFNIGVGQIYCINGTQLASGEWNNLSLQDVLPTWHWIINSSGSKLTPSFDFTKAYNGGTSLNVSGNMTAFNDLRLYEMRLPVSSNTSLKIAYTNGQSGVSPNMQVEIAFTDSPTTYNYITVPNTSTAGWNTAVLNLGSFSGRTIQTIGLNLGNGGTMNGYTINVGQIAIYNGSQVQPAPPTNPVVDSTNTYGSNSVSMRLRWTQSTSAPYGVHHYNIYQVNGGTRTFVGATADNAYFIPALTGPLPVQLQIETVGADAGVSASPLSFTANASTVDGFLLSGHTYALTNGNSGQAVEMGGSNTALGAAVDQYTYYAFPWQEWTAYSLGNHIWKFINPGTGKVLEVGNLSNSPGGAIEQWEWVGNLYQQWTLVSASSGYYYLRNVGSGLILEVPGSSLSLGTALDQNTNTGGNNQQWAFTEVSPFPNTWTYTFFNQYSGSTADITGPVLSDGAPVVEYQLDQHSSQIWSTSQISPGYTRLVNQLSGKTMEVAGSANGNDGSVDQNDWSSSLYQQWIFTGQDGNNVYELANGGSKLALEDYGDAIANGSTIDQYSWLAQSNEEWDVVGIPSVGDSSFEAVPTSSYIYNPSGSAWAFTGQAGISANGSAFTSGNPNAPNGAQVGFVQNTGSFSQAFYNLTPGATYQISFSAAERANYGGRNQTFQIQVNGVTAGTFAPGTSATNYATYTASFITSQAQNTIAFVGTNLNGGDNTILIDNVQLLLQGAPVRPLIQDTSFESVPASTYVYNPTGSSWSFSGMAGLSTNYSLFTYENPPAPLGSQVAFLQDTGSITQTVANFIPGKTYVITFAAAQRQVFNDGGQTFQININGNGLAAFSPGPTAFDYTYYIALFTPTAATNTISFVGTNTNGGDNTIFLDDVTVRQFGP